MIDLNESGSRRRASTSPRCASGLRRRPPTGCRRCFRRRGCRPTARRCAAPISPAGRRATRAPASFTCEGRVRRLGLRSRDRRERRPDRPDLSRDRADRRRAVRGSGPAGADGPAGAAARRGTGQADHSREVARILDGCAPLAGSVGGDLSAKPRPARSRPRPTCCSIPTSPTSRAAAAGPAWSPSCATATASRPAASIAPFCSTTARPRRRRARRCWAPVAGGCGPAVARRRGRSSRHRRGHRDRAVGASDLRRADLGRAVRRRPAPLAVAGRRQPRDHLRRRRRRRHAGRGGARRSAQHRRHRQRRSSRRCTATTSTTICAAARRRPTTRTAGAGEPRRRRRPAARAPLAPSSKPRPQALTNPPDLAGARQSARAARPGPAGTAARAPGAGGDQEPPPASPSPSWKSRSASCAGG